MAVSNSNLHRAKAEKNDEFFTQLKDVANELKHYKEHFKDKIVFCNCDDPTWSAFWKYFHLNFSKLGLKKLISTHYDRNNPTYKMEYEGGSDDNIEIGVITPLEGNGDFRNQECLDLLDSCDIVVTNPPFSLFREYVGVLISHNKNFVIIGNQNAITYKEIFPLIRDDKMWIGSQKGCISLFFEVPDDYIVPENAKRVCINSLGEEYCKQHHMTYMRTACWFTNLDIAKRHEKLILWEKYNPEKFPKYDNYDAINIDKTDEIPVDYPGIMGVPITFLYKHCPEQFEIVAFRKGSDGKDLVFTREIEREFNRIFESLFYSEYGIDYRCEADNLQRWKESLCSNSDTTKEIKFFADYIYANKNLINVAVINQEKEAVSVFFENATNLQNGLVNNCTINGKKTYVRILIRKRGVQ